MPTPAPSPTPTSPNPSGELTQNQVNRLQNESKLFWIASRFFGLKTGYGRKVMNLTNMLEMTCEMEISIGYSTSSLLTFTFSPTRLGIGNKVLGVGITDGYIWYAFTISSGGYKITADIGMGWSNQMRRITLMYRSPSTGLYVALSLCGTQSHKTTVVAIALAEIAPEADFAALYAAIIGAGINVATQFS